MIQLFNLLEQNSCSIKWLEGLQKLAAGIKYRAVDSNGYMIDILAPPLQPESHNSG